MRQSKLASHTGSLVRTITTDYPWGPQDQVVIGGSENATSVLERDDVRQGVVDTDGFRRPTPYSFYAGYKANRFGVYSVGPAMVDYQAQLTLGHRYPTELQVRGQGIVNIGALSKASLPDRNHTLTKALNNLRAENFDLSMTLAEAQQSVDTFAGAAHRIGRLMGAVRQKDPRVYDYLWTGKYPRDGKGKPIRGQYLDRFNRTAAAAFLEWKYGIMPSVLDAKGALKGLERLGRGEYHLGPPLLVARANDKRKQTVTCDLFIAEPGGNSSLRNPAAAVEATLERSIRIDYEVACSSLRALNSFGIGFSTIPTLVFERTPFSFVFNMVVPIAEIIKAWGALQGVTPRGFSETSYEEYELSSGYATSDYPGAVPPGTCTYPKRLIYRKADRKVGVSPPFPAPYVKNPVTTGNMASVLSLFTSLRPRRDNKSSLRQGKI